MPHSISPPRNVLLQVATVSSLSGMTLKRLQKDSGKNLWECSCQCFWHDAYNNTLPISAIKKLEGYIFLSFPLFVIVNKLQFPKVYAYDYMTGETNISKFKLVLQLITWTHFTIELYPKDRRLRTLFTLIFLQQSVYFSVQNLLHLWGNRFWSWLQKCACEPALIKKIFTSNCLATEIGQKDRWPMQSPAPGCFWLEGAEIRFSPLWWQNFWKVNSGPQVAMFLALWRNVSIIGKDEAHNKEARKVTQKWIKSPASLTG